MCSFLCRVSEFVKTYCNFLIRAIAPVLCFIRSRHCVAIRESIYDFLTRWKGRGMYQKKTSLAHSALTLNFIYKHNITKIYFLTQVIYLIIFFNFEFKYIFRTNKSSFKFKLTNWTKISANTRKKSQRFVVIIIL